MAETQLSEVRIDPMTNDASSSWLSSVMKDVKEAKNNQGPNILKVPNELRKDENKECYHPLAVSIGPYHYSERSGKLREAEDQKIAMTRQFVLDTGKPIEQLYRKIEEVAGDARGFYAEGSTDGFNDQEFARMMFLDGCFILQFIHCVRGYRGNFEMSDQQVAHVKRDLLLLENQLPFLVLKDLMKLRYEKGKNDDGMKIICDFLFLQIQQPAHQPLPIWARLLLAPWFFLLLLSSALTFFFFQVEEAGVGIIILGGVIVIVVMLSLFLMSLSVRRKMKKETSGYSGQLPNDQQQPVHLLGLLYFIMLGPQQTKTKPSDAPIGSRGHCLYYSAKDLKKVGIHFKRIKAGALSDVTLKSSFFYRTLNLPPITIDESTKAMFLNLAAYETSAAHEQLWVTSYICLMDSLIHDAEDVKELRSKGIIFNYLGPDQEVADLINHMGSSLESKNISVYNDVKMDINEQSQRIMNKWIADWQHTYFSSPWAFNAFVAAGIGLALGAAQVYYTVNPPEKDKGALAPSPMDG